MGVSSLVPLHTTPFYTDTFYSLQILLRLFFVKYILPLYKYIYLLPLYIYILPLYASIFYPFMQLNSTFIKQNFNLEHYCIARIKEANLVLKSRQKL